MERPEDLDSLAEDWITLWQSEIAGLAADPELIEAWSAFAALGAAWARAMAAMPAAAMRARAHDHAAPPPWAAAPAAAPEPPRPARHGGDGEPGPARDAERERMAARLAELEQRLADLERGPAGSEPDRRSPPRRRRPA